MKRSQRAARLARLVLAAGALSAGAAAPGAAQTVPRIAFEKYTLPNGLEVILHQDRSVPLVATNMWYKVGSGDEKPGRTGFAHLFEHVMFMGSQHVPVGAFDQWLEAAGANNNGTTSFDRTTYFEWMPSNALPLALWLNADRMGWLLPTMDQQKLDVQRDVVKNERRERVDNAPYGRAYETILAALHPAGHPLSWSTIGSMADLGAASLEDVKDFFRTYYAPNNATLVIAGDFDPDSARAWVQRYFAPVPRGPQEPPRPEVRDFQVPRDTFLVLEDRVQLPRLFYAWRGQQIYAPDDAALDVLAAILAGDRNSRLYQRLVYQMQVAQNVGASHQSGRFGGFFLVDVTPKPGQTPQAMARLADEEIRRLADEGISQRELDRARNTIRASFLDRIAGVVGKAEMLAQYNHFVGDPDYVQRDAARYDAVSAADVQRVAREYLASKRRVVLTVVPEGKKDMMVTGAQP